MFSRFDNMIKNCKGWHVYQSFQNLEFDKKQIGDKEFETSIKLMNMQNQIKKYEKYIKKVPKEILEEIDRKERKHNYYKDKEMER